MNNSNTVAHTIGEIRQTQTNFTWFLREFKVLSNFKKISSPMIDTKTNGIPTHWKIYLYPTDETDDKDYMGIYIKCLNRDSIIATVELSLIDRSNNLSCRFTLDNQEFQRNELWGCSRFVEYNDIKPLFNIFLTDKTLKINCIITTNETMKIVENVKREQQINQQRISLLDRYENLINNKNFSDVILSIKGKDLYAYKGILANVSPVFRAMFTHDMLEMKSNHVQITDIDYDIMLELMRYIYTGKIKYTNCQIKDLLIAAEKYQLPDLKYKCEKYLSENFNVNDIFDYLNLADSYNCDYLKEKSIGYMISNVSEIIELPTFKNYGYLPPDICCEVFRALAIKKLKDDN